jgi:hypothetical protein
MEAVVSRYSKQHYEDVARILAEEQHFQETSGRPEGLSAAGAVINLKHTFADLFAADNPKRCSFHGEHDTGYSEDCKITGFDREQFLAACGLEPVPEICPLCNKPSKNGEVHLDCANYEQAMADAEGESQENLEAAEALYNHTVREDS